MGPSVMVFGPAYLDRILRLEEPLLGKAARDPLDRSVGGTLRFASGSGLKLVDPGGHSLDFSLPDDWPGPLGTIALDGALIEQPLLDRQLRCTGWTDDLGGMGRALRPPWEVR